MFEVPWQGRTFHFSWHRTLSKYLFPIMTYHTHWPFPIESQVCVSRQRRRHYHGESEDVNRTPIFQNRILPRCSFSLTIYRAQKRITFCQSNRIHVKNTRCTRNEKWCLKCVQQDSSEIESTCVSNVHCIAGRVYESYGRNVGAEREMPIELCLEML